VRMYLSVTLTPMPRKWLTINPGSPEAWEVDLKPGRNSLGRDDQNDIVLNHPSVSGLHCQIILTDAGVLIEDADSANGTCVGDELIRQSVLLPDQRIRLGQVIAQFHSETPAVSIASESSPPPVSPVAAMFCKFHPKSVARFLCPKCHRAFCNLCVNGRLVGGQSKSFCRLCAVECAPLENSAAPALDNPTFAMTVRDAFAYPLRGDGFILLIAGGLLFLVIDAAKFIVRFAFIYGLAAFVILTIFGAGYLTAYLRRILNSSADGEKNMPDWPEITDFGSDIASPFFQLIGTVAFCFAPAIAVTIYAFFAPEGGEWLGWLTTASIVFGCAYFPMAFTAVAMFDSLVALNPLLIVPSILKIPREYLLTIVLLAAILSLRKLSHSILPGILPIPILPSLLADFFELYLMAVEMRVLGLLYQTKKDELGWFRR